MTKTIGKIMVALIIVVLPFTSIEKSKSFNKQSAQPPVDYENLGNYPGALLTSSTTQSGSCSNERDSWKSLRKENNYVSTEIRVVSYWLLNR